MYILYVYGTCSVLALHMKFTFESTTTKPHVIRKMETLSAAQVFCLCITPNIMIQEIITNDEWKKMSSTIIETQYFQRLNELVYFCTDVLVCMLWFGFFFSTLDRNHGNVACTIIIKWK